MARKLFAMEDNEVVENPEQGESTLPEVINEVADVKEEAADIEETADAVEEGADASDQLEEVKEVVEQAEEEGGLDPVAAEAVRIAVSAIAARLGKNVNDIIPSYAAENFQSKAARKGNTRLALEGITETLSKTWKMIVETISGLYKKIVGFFTSYNEAFKKVLTEAKNIANSAKKANVSETRDVTYPESISKQVPADIDEINASTFITLVERLKFNDVEKVIESTDKTISTVSDLVLKFTKDDNATEVTDTEAKINEALDSLVKNNSDTVIVPSDGEALVDGKVLKVSVSKETNSVGLNVEIIDKKTHSGDTEGKLLTSEEVVSLMGVVTGLKGTVDEYHKAAEKAQKEYDKVIATIDKVISDDKYPEDKKTAITDNLKPTLGMRIKVADLYSKLLTLNLDTATACLKVGDFTVKQYSAN